MYLCNTDPPAPEGYSKKNLLPHNLKMCPLLGWIVLVSKVLRREQEGIWILEPAKFYLAVSSFSQLSLWGIDFHPYHTLLSFLENSINIEWILSYLFLSTEHEFGHLFRFHLFHTQIHRHIYNVSVFKTTSALSTYCVSLLLFLLLLLPSSVSQVFPLYLRSWLCLTIFCPLFCHLSPTCFWSFSHSPSFHPRWTLWIFKYTYRRGRSSALQGLHNPATPVHLYSHWSFGKAEKDSRQFLALYSADGNSWNQDFACSCPIPAEAAWVVQYFSEIKPDSSLAYTCVSMSPESGP